MRDKKVLYSKRLAMFVLRNQDLLESTRMLTLLRNAIDRELKKRM